MQVAISQEELNERIAILKRLRSLLEQQRAKFTEYLKVLELQEEEIKTQDADAMFSYCQLGDQVVQSIGTLQKIIVPIQALSSTKNAAFYSPKEVVSSVFALQQELDTLQTKTKLQNLKNQSLLKSYLPQVRQEISMFKNPYRSHNSVYAERETSGSYLQIEV